MQTGQVLHVMHIRSLSSHTAGETQIFAGQCHYISLSLQLLTPGAAVCSLTLLGKGGSDREAVVHNCSQKELLSGPISVAQSMRQEPA